MLSDEVRCCSQSYHDRILICPHRGECRLPTSVPCCHTGLSLWVMMWDANRYMPESPFTRINKILDRYCYISIVLSPEALPYSNFAKRYVSAEYCAPAAQPCMFFRSPTMETSCLWLLKENTERYRTDVCWLASVAIRQSILSSSVVWFCRCMGSCTYRCHSISALMNVQQNNIFYWW